MKSRFIFWCGILVCCSGAMAQTEQLIVSEGYVRALPPTVSNTAAYMSLHNHGNTLLRLTGARTDVADRVQVHETVEQNGMLHMQHLPVVEIPPGDMLVLESGGLHMMVMGLKRPLVAGDELELTLQFEGGDELSIVVPVQSVMVESMHEGH